jgi:hypothetical protein
MTMPDRYPEYPWFDNYDSCGWRDARQERVVMRDFREQRRKCEKMRKSPVYSKIMSLSGGWDKMKGK